jgi:predicted porin
MNNGYGFGLVTNAGQSVTYDTQGFLPSPAGFNPSPTAGPSRAAFVDYYDSDSSKVIYVSPRLFGAQVGVSYAPESGRDQLSSAGPPLAGSDTNRRLPGVATVHSMWSFGANYEVNLYDVKTGIAAGYGSASQATGGINNTANADPQYWVVGARFDWGGFRFAAGYSKLWNSPVTAGQSPDGYGYKVGGLYSWGANAVSLNYQAGAEQGSASTATPAAVSAFSNSDHIQKMSLAYARTLAPGIKWTANLFYANYASEADGIAGNPDYSGWATVTSVRLDF